MTAVAVGLFEDSVEAHSVLDALHANAIPSNRIRILTQPIVSSKDGASSATSMEFTTALRRELRALGATEAESDAWVNGLLRGNALIFVSGSSTQAEYARVIMNAYDPLSIEERGTAVPGLPGMHVSEASNDAHTSKPEAARLFTR